jgi:hypothetical protein
MYAELHQYLIQHRILPVPGLGTFLLERSPAEADIPNRVILAPTYRVRYKAEVEPFPKHFFSWLGHMLNVTDREAQMRFEAFGSKLIGDTLQGKIVKWEGVGEIRKKKDQFQFTPQLLTGEDPVPSIKVIRQHAEHQVRVGEDLRSSGEMTRMLNPPVSRKRYPLLVPLMLLVLAVIFITWYFFSYGFTPLVK